MKLRSLIAGLIFLVAGAVQAQTIRPTNIAQVRHTPLTSAQEATMTLGEGDVWYNSDLDCIRMYSNGAASCINPVAAGWCNVSTGIYAATAAGIQTALDDANCSDIFVPKGTYALGSTTLTITRADVRLIFSSGAVLTYLTGTNFALDIGDAASIKENIQVINPRIQGNASAAGGIRFRRVRFCDVWHPVIEDFVGAASWAIKFDPTSGTSGEPSHNRVYGSGRIYSATGIKNGVLFATGGTGGSNENELLGLAITANVGGGVGVYFAAGNNKVFGGSYGATTGTAIKLDSDFNIAVGMRVETSTTGILIDAASTNNWLSPNLFDSVATPWSVGNGDNLILDPSGTEGRLWARQVKAVSGQPLTFLSQNGTSRLSIGDSSTTFQSVTDKVTEGRLYPTPAGTLDLGFSGNEWRHIWYSGQLNSTVATGTAPFVVASTTNIPNLNASLLLGKTWAIPDPIGATTPNTVAATSLTTGGAVTLNGSVSQGTALKFGSVTTGSIGASASAAVTLTFSGVFTNAAWVPNCNVIEATTGTDTLRIHHIESITNTTNATVVVRIVNDSGVSARTGTLVCSGVSGP